MTQQSATVFVDCDLLLHFKPLQDIDWPKLIDARTVRLVVVPIIVRQLDKHKDTHHQKAIRKRAASRLADFRSAVTRGNEVEIRANVTLWIDSVEPRLDLSEHQLRHDVDDDYFLASAIEYRERHPQVSVYVATADIGLMLKCGHHRIPIIELGDELRLPQAPDTEMARIRALETELEGFKRAIPQLSVCWKVGSDHRTIRRRVDSSSSAGDIAAELERLKKRFPPRGRVAPRPDDITAIVLAEQQKITAMLDSIRPPLERVPEEEISLYNRELDTFYRDYEEYLKKLEIYSGERARTVVLILGLLNSGTAPAEDIDISLHFSGRVRTSGREEASRKAESTDTAQRAAFTL